MRDIVLLVACEQEAICKPAWAHETVALPQPSPDASRFPLLLEFQRRRVGRQIVDVNAAESPAVHSTPPLAITLPANRAIETDIARDHSAVHLRAFDPCIQVFYGVLSTGVNARCSKAEQQSLVADNAAASSTGDQVVASGEVSMSVDD